MIQLSEYAPMKLFIRPKVYFIAQPDALFAPPG
jgi:hypothetical protein